MKTVCMLYVVIAFILFSTPTGSCENKEFPQREITIVVYTSPGGLIDIVSRKTAKIAGDLGKARFIVRNKKGAGGMLAVDYVRRAKPDGYTLLAITRSLISKLVFAKKEVLLDEFDMLAEVMADKEALIVRDNSPIKTVHDLIEESTKRRLLWAGPSVGGFDYLFAKWVWKKLGIGGRWIPYTSGLEALMSVLGGHTDIYVGNPSDIRDREGFRIISLSQYAHTNGKEGSEKVKHSSNSVGLDDMRMWRGFAVRRDVPLPIKRRIVEILRVIAQTDEWRRFCIFLSAECNFQDVLDNKNYLADQIERDKRLYSETGDARTH